jgi:hypothetical protein
MLQAVALSRRSPATRKAGVMNPHEPTCSMRRRKRLPTGTDPGSPTRRWSARTTPGHRCRGKRSGSGGYPTHRGWPTGSWNAGNNTGTARLRSFAPGFAARGAPLRLVLWPGRARPPIVAGLALRYSAALTGGARRNLWR